MRNIEHYPDPTAGMAMTQRPQRMKSIQAPPKRTHPELPAGKVPAVGYKQKPKTVYFSKPAYVAK